VLSHESLIIWIWKRKKSHVVSATFSVYYKTMWNKDIRPVLAYTVLVSFYSKTNEIHQFFKFILFCSSTLHVSGCLSVHHQESKTVHTTSGICQTDSADCLLLSSQPLECMFYYCEFHKIIIFLITKLLGIVMYTNCVLCEVRNEVWWDSDEF
jgi:hypothetical protein